MGHNLSGHDHAHLEMKYACQEHEDIHHSLSHLLLHFFETDLGEDHLENFENSGTQQFFATISNFALSFDASCGSYLTILSPSQAVPDLTHAAGVRGPPIA